MSTNGVVNVNCVVEYVDECVFIFIFSKYQEDIPCAQQLLAQGTNKH